MKVHVQCKNKGEGRLPNGRAGDSPAVKYEKLIKPHAQFWSHTVLLEWGGAGI